MGKLGKPVLRGENKRLPHPPSPDSSFLSLSGCPDGRDKTRCLGQAAVLGEGVGGGERTEREAETDHSRGGGGGGGDCLWLRDPE